MNLKLLRKEKGYTQGELADKLGISQNYFSEIETGGRPLTEKLRLRLAELGIHIVEVNEGKKLVSLSYIDISASAGRGIMNLAEFPQIKIIDVPVDLLNIPLRELEGCYVLQARGNSMSPVIDNGDRLVVKELQSVPKYLEGNFIVNYEGEIYVKTIQLDHDQIIMKSINSTFKDIIVDLKSENIYLQIIAKVLSVIKNM